MQCAGGGLHLIARRSSMEDRILERAAEVRRMGCYVGFWEFVCWGELTQSRVLILFGENLVDVREQFAPDLPALPATCPVHVPVATMALMRFGIREIMRPV